MYLWKGADLNGSLTGFVTLTLIILSVLVCLLPNKAYFTWSMLTDVQSDEGYRVVDALQRLTAVIDPVIIGPCTGKR